MYTQPCYISICRLVIKCYIQVYLKLLFSFSGKVLRICLFFLGNTVSYFFSKIDIIYNENIN